MHTSTFHCFRKRFLQFAPKVFPLFLFSFLDLAIVQAQWQQVGPNSTTISKEVSAGNAIGISNNEAGGIFVSLNGGKNWTNKGEEINHEFVNALISDGQHFFCSTYQNVYESDDLGNTWFSILYNITPEIITLDDFDNRLFAITGKTLFYKDLGEAQWHTSLTNYVTGNKGASLSLASQFDTLYFSIEDFDSYFNTEYISHDNGQSWVQQSNNQYYSYIDNKPGFEYVGDSLFYFSLNHTKKRTSINANNFSFTYSNPNYFYIAYDSGSNRQYVLQYDTALNRKWVDSTLNEKGSVIYLFNAGDSLYEYRNFKLFVSGNNGDSWTLADAEGLFGMVTRFFSVIDSAYYAGTYLGVFVSKDQGGSWLYLQNDSLPDFTKFYNPIIPFSSQYPEQYPVDLFNVKDTFYLAAYDSGIYRSTDHGATWHAAGFNHTPNVRVNFLLQGHSSYYVLNKLVKHPLFAGLQSNGENSSAGLYIRDADDTSWIQPDPFDHENYTFGREVKFSKYPGMYGYYFIASQQLKQDGHPSIPYVANSFFTDSITNFYLCTQQGIFKYLWSIQSENAPKYNIIDVSNNLPLPSYPFPDSRWINDGFILGSKIYIAGESGVFVADTSNFLWTDISYNLKGIAVNQLKYYKGYIYTSTDQGVFKIDETITGVETPPAPLPDFLIYPNPSSSSFFIRVHSIPSEKLSLTILNLSGQVILNTTVNQGLNKVQFNSSLCNGIYLCRLFSGRQLVAQQKLAIMK